MLKLAHAEELKNIRTAHEQEKESTGIAHKEENESTRIAHEAEVHNLNRRVEELQRDPFGEDIKDRVKAGLRDLDEKERIVLKNLLHYGTWDYNRVMPKLTCTVGEQAEVFRKGYGAGFLDTEEVMFGGHRRMHYKVRPQYEAALKKYLYETPKGLEKLRDLQDSQ